MLATAPMTISAVEPLKYSHEQQAIEASYTVAQRQTTWNGTRTFDWQGKPNDADND